MKGEKSERKPTEHGLTGDEDSMTTQTRTKVIHEAGYAAVVEVEVIDTADGWSPYLALSDARKLDAVRQALRNGDLKQAARLGRVFELTPVAAD